MNISPDDILALDIEASGLHRGSYPVQIGWCPLSLEASSFYIRRPDAWDDRGWSYESEKIHGISRPDLQNVGLDISECAGRFVRAIEGRHLVSDNPAFETLWLSEFYSQTGLGEVPFVWHLHTMLDALAEANGVDPLLVRELPALIRKTYPHTHRADDDALSMAAVMKAVAHPRFGRPYLDAVAAAEGQGSFEDLLRGPEATPCIIPR